mmetsp:Transcript_28352/g.90913  ORF Transcript_28352/g.90913 Transcript_28352/m.90913 type:complete len:262 (+) Transcript_28352:2425-3210(+)
MTSQPMDLPAVDLLSHNPKHARGEHCREQPNDAAVHRWPNIKRPSHHVARSGGDWVSGRRPPRREDWAAADTTRVDVRSRRPRKKRPPGRRPHERAELVDDPHHRRRGPHHVRRAAGGLWRRWRRREDGRREGRRAVAPPAQLPEHEVGRGSKHAHGEEERERYRTTLREPRESGARRRGFHGSRCCAGEARRGGGDADGPRHAAPSPLSARRGRPGGAASDGEEDEHEGGHEKRRAAHERGRLRGDGGREGRGRRRGDAG